MNFQKKPETHIFFGLIVLLFSNRLYKKKTTFVFTFKHDCVRNQEDCCKLTLTNLFITIRNDQAKDGQASTFYMTTPPLISVRLSISFLASEKVKVLNHPPYSPDLSSYDFFLFPRVKKNV